MLIYRQTSDKSHILVGKKIVDPSNVVGASPVSAAPITSSFATWNLASMDWAKATTRRDEKHLSFWIWCVWYKRFDGNPFTYLAKLVGGRKIWWYSHFKGYAKLLFYLYCCFILWTFSWYTKHYCKEVRLSKKMRLCSPRIVCMDKNQLFYILSAYIGVRDDLLKQPILLM